ncbi:3-carboxy-cis,cis-muconate cycloisomerase [Antribacter sp. KLBMP9083]|uniref:3-carboxy-cis,cis-muconate cycloisomerase n=1 Tax=Antribacter soli TaxID=2910976 RepID=A0AA41U9J8_9MICO|nr:lyase family protein [Antribacter soli]MCF4123615.1 3-carboxy-cis,cis-muconate cycloisomerase [Antribacter soli]
MPDLGLLTPGADLAPGSAAVVTDDVAVLRAMLAAEVAWVEAQAACGLVGPGTAAAVRAAAAALLPDDARAGAEELVAAVAREAAATGNPVVPLLARLRPAVGKLDPAATAALHRGLTSQDVVDTALVLVVRGAAAAVAADLGRVRAALTRLAREHRSTPALARTLAQAAVPTTFGARVAGWLQAVAEADDRLAAEAAALPVSYGGAAGTLDAVPADRFALVDAWGAALGLPVTAGPWHVTRFPVERAAAALAGVCAALGTVASDVLQGARPESGELREPSAPGRGASSTMAHKRNPVLSVLLRRSALAAPPLVAQVFTAAGLAVDERPDGAWHAEWPALRDLARHAVASAHLAAELLEGLTFDRAAAARNLDLYLGEVAGGGERPASGSEAGPGRDTGAAEAVVDRVLARYAGPPPA